MRDRDIRNSMYALIEATGVFDYLPIGRPPGSWAPAAVATKSLSIDPYKVVMRRAWDTGGDQGVEIDGKVKVVITAADDDPQIRDELCEQLYDIAANALDEQALPAGAGGLTTMPAFTYFESYQWLPPALPNRQIVAIFVYRYLLPSDTSFDVTT